MNKIKLYIFTLIFVCLIPLAAQNKKEKINELLNLYNEYGLFNGSALVAETGHVILSKGYGFANIEWGVPNTPDTKFRIGSISKQFTAAIIMQLVEEEKINLDGKITDYLPGYKKETGSKVTIHHLLTHTSGIPNYTSIPNVWSDSLRNHYKQDYFVKQFHSGELVSEPGKEYSYNNTGYYLLSVIAEEVTGKDFGKLLEERIFIPAGMTNTGSEDDEFIVKKKAYGYLKSGNNFSTDQYIYMPNAKGAGHMYSTVEDLLKWDQALYTNKILSEDSKEKIFTPFLNNYGYGWIITKLPLNDSSDSIAVFLHGGGIYGFNTIFTRLPEKKYAVVIFNNTGNAPLSEMTENIINILYDKEYSKPKIPISNVLAEIIETEGIDAAALKYNELKKEHPDDYNFAETQLNSLGYVYLRNENIEAALKIFKLNVEAYPEAFNTYDSYAEALMQSGDNEGAINNYKRSLEINPGNANGIAMLKKLGVEYKHEIKVETTKLSRYEGNYKLFPNFVITIRTEGEKIYAKATGQSEFEIYPQSETKFYYKVVPAQIEFMANEEGNFNKMVLYQNNQEMPGERMD